MGVLLILESVTRPEKDLDEYADGVKLMSCNPPNGSNKGAPLDTHLWVNGNMGQSMGMTRTHNGSPLT